MSEESHEIYIASDNSVWFVGLAADSAPRDYINDATLTFSLYASKAHALAKTNEISGADEVSMPSIGSKGTYRGVLDDAVTAALTEDAVYWIRVNINAGDGRKRACFHEYTAKLGK